MNLLKLSSAVICVLNICTFGFATSCKVGQYLVNGRCCNMCRPGEYLREVCSENKQTVCSPCAAGYFSDKFNIFDRCERCLSCQQEYDEKCTLTTNAKCLCRSGFLCSNDVCATCEENKCVTWEKVKKTEIPSREMVTYSYRCEPACANNTYFDAQDNTCKPFTQCSAFGLPELFRGNKTHNSVCDIPRNGGGLVHVILGVGFILLSVTLLLRLSYVCIKNLRTHKANRNPTPVSTNLNDIHLSKEESGLQLIIQDESKDRSSLGPLHLGQISIL